MAFFKFRKGADESAATHRQPESIEAMRRRARHRLIGAGVLVLTGVVGFPLLFDTQPRQVAVDIPIEIPDRAKAKPLPAPPQRTPAASGAVTPAPAAKAVPVEAATQAKAESRAEAVKQPEPAKPEPKAEAKPEPKPEPKAAAKAEAKPVNSAAADGRYVVQVGAFSDVHKAREARLKVERAGLKTYTNVADTKDGKRIRVRVGPFGSRAEADKAAGKIKGLDLPAAILTL